jgi:hypothetical protein
MRTMTRDPYPCARIHERSYLVTKFPSTSAFRKECQSIRVVGFAVRFWTQTGGTEGEQVQVYILSDVMLFRPSQEAVRGHWPIEATHWAIKVPSREF